MNLLGDGFRARTSAVIDLWRATFADAIAAGSRPAWCAPGLTPPTPPALVIAQIEGTRARPVTRRARPT